MQIIGILWLKTHYFSQFITKLGFCCQILSLNDLTPSPISQPGTQCLQWQRANARGNLWWRHEPFPGETSIALRPCAGKAGVAKRSWWCLGIIPSNICCQFSMITERRTSSTNHLFTPAAYSGTCWSQGSHSNSAREISRAIFGAACRTECMLH